MGFGFGVGFGCHRLEKELDIAELRWVILNKN
jgi:hypothetical protein